MGGVFIGMDEAGLGPNLGPLVITVSVWEIDDGAPQDVDFWKIFEPVLVNSPERNDPRLHLADSKEVYTPSRGLRRLEQTVLCGLRLLGVVPSGFHELLSHIAEPFSPPQLPWWDAEKFDVSLPQSLSKTVADMLDQTTARWNSLCEQHGVRLRAVQSDCVTPERFNRLIEQHGNKGTVLSKTSLQLLRRVWEPSDESPTLIIADKHGGRNRYDELLAEIADGQIISSQLESKEQSRYRVGTADVRFQMRAERYLPVALASMVCKYLRELSMDLFNQFWQQQVPNLKATKGYPQDAKRFKKEIAERQEQLGISDAIFWRCR